MAGTKLPLHSGDGRGEGEYQDIPGFCKAAKLEEIKGHNYVLTPGRYVGAAAVDADDISFMERYLPLQTELNKQFDMAEKLNATIRANLARVMVDDSL